MDVAVLASGSSGNALVVAHGDTGTVYRADSTSSNNAVAVKLLK